MVGPRSGIDNGVGLGVVPGVEEAKECVCTD